MKVLVVDDEEDIRCLIKILLEREGFKVLLASGGVEALEKAVSDKPDLIMLDLIMPGKDGLEVCEILKSNAATSEIPVIVASVIGGAAERRRAFEVGASAYLNKPIDPQELSNIINEQLNRKKEKQTQNL